MRPDQTTRTEKRPSRAPAQRALQGVLVASGCLLFTQLSPRAHAQPDNTRAPVFIANAPLAEEALATIGPMVARGGVDEAVRLIQRVIDEQGRGLIASGQDGLFITVRDRLHDALLRDSALLGEYRERQTPRAEALLEAGSWREVERSYWLTRPGAEASLRLAQTLIESARFESGLHVLETLASHPDAGEIARDAMDLSATVSALLDRDEAWTLTEAWSARAGLRAPERAAIPRPERAGRSLGVAGIDRGSASDPSALAGVVRDSLHHGELSELAPSPEQIDPPGGRGGPVRPMLPWSIPTLDDGRVLTADGFTISCFDRFSMRPLWRVHADQGDSRPDTRELRGRLGRVVEDSATVTVDGGLAFAPLGLPRSDSDRSPGRVVCVEVDTGRVRWSVAVSSLSEELAGAEPRGPIVIDGDTVIVGARKNQRTRRLVGLTLVGLDRETGELRWAQPIGSAGSLPFQQPTHLGEGGVVQGGVVYWTDKMGLVAAVETATGRARWVRESPAPTLYTRGTRVPYATSLPVITGRGLFVLTPDQALVRLIDPASGEVLHERAAEPFADAGYLIRAGDRLAAIGSGRVAFYDIASFESELPALTVELDDTGIRGRAVSVGDQVVVPVRDGLAMVDPRRTNSDGLIESELIPLSHTGNPAVGEGQVVIAGESDVHSFLAWETASRMLSARIDAGDAGAALALAELALRSGRTGRVLGAIDEAVRLSGRDSAKRTRAFAVLRAMLETGPGTASIGLAMRGQVLERLGVVATGHEQRVVHAMAVGDWLAMSGDVPAAAREFQDVLLDESLSKAIWTGGGLSVRAELEATRRLQDLAERFGSGATSDSDELAQQRVAALGADPDPERWAELARRFPVSRVAPGAWQRAATGWVRRERWAAAERSARSGFRAIELARRRGDAAGVDPAVPNELGGALVLALRSQSRIEDAGPALDTISDRIGMAVTPVLDGRPVSVDRDPGQRGPVLGGVIKREATPALIAGSPVAPSVGRDPSLVLMQANQLGRLTLYRSSDGALEQVWSLDGVGSAMPLLAHADERALVLVWPTERAVDRPASAVALDPATGRTLWEVDLDERLEAVQVSIMDPGARLGGQVLSPSDGSVGVDQMLASCDGRTLFVTDRRGRALGIDVGNGRGLWAGALALSRVFSIDMGGGVVGIAGARPRDAQVGDDPRGVLDQDGTPGLRGVCEVLDPRTGETIQIIDELDPNTYWVRVASDGQVIVGTQRRVVALDSAEGRVGWSNGDEVLAESRDAWIVGDWLVLLGDDRSLWAVPRHEGVRRSMPLDTLGRGVDRGFVSVERFGSRFAVIGAGGLCVYDKDGTLVGADAAVGDRPYILTELCDSHAVFLERPAVGEDERTTATVMLVDRESGSITDRAMLEIPVGVRRSPARMAIGEGVVVIGFNEVSMVLSTPRDEN